jgi:hypothetical protein
MINVYETGILFTSIGLGICGVPAAVWVMTGDVSPIGWYCLVTGFILAAWSSCALMMEKLEDRRLQREAALLDTSGSEIEGEAGR